MIKKLFLILLVVAIICAFAGCKNTGTKVSTTDPPKQLDKIESAAGDVLDNIAANDWMAAQSKVTEIESDFTKVKPTLKKAKVSSDTISGLSNAIKGLSTAVSAEMPYDARAEANKILKFLPDVYDYYKTIVPTDLGRLDYLGREIILNAEKYEWEAATTNCSNALSLWGDLKTKLKADYNNDVASFQNAIDDLQRSVKSKDAAAVTKQAGALLDQVDVLEKDFLEQYKKK